MVAIHFNILHFRPASIRYSRFLLFSIPRNKLLKNRTLNVVFKHLVWSFNWAYTGKHPESGPGNAPLFGNHLKLAGSPICRANRKFALVELRGDQEFHRDIWRFTSSWQANVVCHRCPAVAKGDPAYLYYNVGPTSRWLDDEFGLTQFVSRRLRESQLSLSAKLIAFLTLFACYWIFDFPSIRPSNSQNCVLGVIFLGFDFFGRVFQLQVPSCYSRDSTLECWNSVRCMRCILGSCMLAMELPCYLGFIQALGFPTFSQPLGSLKFPGNMSCGAQCS